MTIYFLLILLSLVILHIAIRYNKSARFYNKLPGLTPLPFFGNILQLNLPREKLWETFREKTKNYEILRMWFPTTAIVFIRHPDDIKTLLSSKENVNKGFMYGNFKFFGGQGIVLSKRDLWKQRRKLVSPAFSPAMLKMNFEVVRKHVKKLITCIKSQDDEIIEILPLFKKFAIDITCENAMGVDIRKSEIVGKEKFMHSLDFTNEVVVYRLLRPYIKDWMMNWLPIGREQSRCIAEGRIFRDKIIAERRKHLNENVVDNVDDDHEYRDRNRIRPLLDILLYAEKNGSIDNQGIGDETSSFLAAGYDTTALSVSCTLILLAENKKAQELARTEITEIYNQSNGKITDIETQKMEYLDRCIKESLRLFPTIPTIGRCTSEGLQLRNYYIPAETDLVIDIFDLHRDPKFWPEPEKFDPDRFLPEHVQKRHPFAYIPFSAGIRNCIGMKYAMMSIKTVLSHILYNFYVESVDETTDFPFKIHTTLNHNCPMRVKFIKINHTTE